MLKQKFNAILPSAATETNQIPYLTDRNKPVEQKGKVVTNNRGEKVIEKVSKVFVDNKNSELQQKMNTSGTWNQNATTNGWGSNNSGSWGDPNTKPSGWVNDIPTNTSSSSI